MRAIIIIAIVAIIGCESQPLGRDNPTAAFGRLAPCINKASTACLFRELDRDSRWSIHSIHRTLTEIKTLVESSYPLNKDTRSQALGNWKNEAEAKSAEEMFHIFCLKTSCLRTLAKGFGAVVAEKKVDETMIKIETTRGEFFQMKNINGEWGLATHRDELQKTKIRFMDNLKQVRQNAAAYDQQRRATGN